MMTEGIKTLYVFISAACALIPTTLAAILASKFHWSGVCPGVVFVCVFALVLMALTINYAGTRVPHLPGAESEEE